MIVAVVLSAGESSRMGRPKALLPIHGQTFIEKIVGALRQTPVGKVIVILGHNAAEMRERIEHLPVEILINPDYKLGQLSSLQVAVRRLETEIDCDGMLVHLVDHPYIDSKLVENMIERFYASGKFIVVPRYRHQARPSGDFLAPALWRAARGADGSRRQGGGQRAPRRHFGNRHPRLWCHSRYRYAGTLPAACKRRIDVQA